VNFSAISLTANTPRFSPAESIECGLGILAERLFLRAEFASATGLRINLDLADRTGIGIGRNSASSRRRSPPAARGARPGCRHRTQLAGGLGFEPRLAGQGAGGAKCLILSSFRDGHDRERRNFLHPNLATAGTANPRKRSLKSRTTAGECRRPVFAPLSRVSGFFTPEMGKGKRHVSVNH
jgi:hypothetical protein